MFTLSTSSTLLFSNLLLYSFFFFLNLNGCDTIASCILIYPRYLCDWIGQEMVNLSDASSSAQNFINSLGVQQSVKSLRIIYPCKWPVLLSSVWEWELFGLIKEIDKYHCRRLVASKMLTCIERLATKYVGSNIINKMFDMHPCS